jgi:phosphoadenosine phosphosulfate reductase
VQVSEQAQKIIEKGSIVDSLNALAREAPGQVVFSTSFSWEDQLITHIIFSNNIPIDVFTLDTGRMFPETYYTWSQTLEKYGKKITAYYPDATTLQGFIAEKGPNSFYESVDNRKQCCHIRKVEPLKRALKGRKIWITGIRAEHSANRDHMPQVEWDEGNEVIKYHPLLHWTTKQVTDAIKEQEIPYNPLHDKGFVSIGCAPCTRAVRPGEDFRAGRWWWEDSTKKECGLHIHAPEENKQ